jgi:hypothetical protein
MNEALQSAVQCRLTASLLALGSKLDVWSLALLGITLLVLFLLPFSAVVTGVLGAACIAALVQKYFALRVALDATVFADWAMRWTAPGSTGNTVEDDLRAFDDTLKKANTQPLRPLDSRAEGAKRLLQCQALAALIQFALLLLASGLHFLGF